MPDDENLPEIDPGDIPEVTLSTEQANFLKSIENDSVMFGKTAISMRDDMQEKRLVVLDKWPWIAPLEKKDDA